MQDHEQWFEKAPSDLKMAKKGLLNDDETLDFVVYHAHQCVEKYLKGYLIFRGNVVERTHDLDYLLKLCCGYDLEFFALKSDAKKLNPYAVHSRYPDDRFFVDRKVAEDAVATATVMVNFVNKKVTVI